MKTKAPPPNFEVGERVSYYPPRKRADAYEHFEATVIGTSKSGRPRIEFAGLLIGTRKRPVSPHSLTRQHGLPV